MKVRIGISFDQEVVDALDEQVRLSPDLALNRSEVVNVVVKTFFKAGLDHRTRTRELVIMNRNGHLKLESVHGVHSSEVQAVPTIRT
jgi:metal-responsive CopG/Arc/MetJ family transcriptional regulator